MTTLHTVIGAIFGALVLVSALWVVTLRNLFRAALSLGLVLLGVAALFLLLDAEFLAFVQILVYVGAILTLIVFAIMLTGKQVGTVEASPSRQRLPAAIACGLLFATLVNATHTLMWPQAPVASPVPPPELGQQFVTQLVLPFELVSLVFVAAIVGAIAIAAPRQGTPLR